MQQTLSLLTSAYAEKEIAQELGVSRHTVHVYIKALYKRFGATTRAELLVTVFRRGEAGDSSDCQNEWDGC